MFVLAFIVEPPFIVSILILCGGCLFIALSIISQIKSDVIINPTEAIIKVISEKLNIEFSKVKVSFDSGLVVVALILSLIVFKRIIGLGLGTLVSAFLVGYFFKIFKAKRRGGLMLNSLIIMDLNFVNEVYDEDSQAHIRVDLFKVWSN